MSRSVVLDTNILVSAALWPQSAPARVFRRVWQQGALVACVESVAELRRVLRRPKFDRIAPPESRDAFAELVARNAAMVDVLPQHHALAHGACRDADDNLFLALALTAEARTIVTGDADLLALHPWQGIILCTAAGYLEREI